MDPKAYEKAKHYVREMVHTEPASAEPPPPGTNIREWVLKRAQDRRPEMEQRHLLAIEPRTWSPEEQDALAEIAASPDEPPRERQFAMIAIPLAR